MSTILRTNIRNILRSKLVGKENLENRNKLREKLQISDSTIKNWVTETGTNMPNILLVPEICSILNLTYYEFFGIDSSSIPFKEKELIEAYNIASEEAKAIINNILKLK